LFTALGVLEDVSGADALGNKVEIEEGGVVAHESTSDLR
jgi:hypothetical protein